MPIIADTVARLRHDTPGVTGVVHLNNAGAAFVSTATLNAQIAHLRLEAQLGGYEAKTAVADALAEVRGSAARLMNASASEIAVPTSDTAGWAKVFWGFGFGGGFATKRRVVIDRIFYNSHYLSLLQAHTQFGIEIVVAPSDESGRVDVDGFSSLLDDRVALVSMTMAPTHSGIVNPVALIGAHTKRAGVPYFVDGCQALGQLVVDVDAIGCDALTGTGRKWLRGPRGTGLLYVRGSFQERCDPPGIDGVSAVWESASSYSLASGAARFEEFESSTAGQLGLGVAIEEALALGVDAIAERVQHLATYLRTELTHRERVTVQETAGACSGIVTFIVDGVTPADVVAAAAKARINMNASSTPWARLDLEARGVADVARVAPHVYNTEDELDQLLAVIDSL
jgi:cysteine desulfurase / selenocysteine lyase